MTVPSPRGPTAPLEALHRGWCAAVEGRFADRLAPVGFPVGYEHAYATAGPGPRQLVLVCPWHWRQYSHYQFWELAAAAFLARGGGYAGWALLTNGAWTPWIPPALGRLYGDLLLGDLPAALDRLDVWLGAPPEPPALPAVRSPGPVLLGEIDPRATTVVVKDRLARLGPERLRRGSPVPSLVPGAVLRPAFASPDGRTLVVVKGFRNPDPVHEAKMLAGRAYLCPPAHRLVVVVDGRLGEVPAMIAAGGAAVCTPDRLAEALAHA